MIVSGIPSKIFSLKVINFPVSLFFPIGIIDSKTNTIPEINTSNKALGKEYSNL